MFQVYLLADYQSYLVYYVGYSKHYLHRFQEHCRSNWKIQEIFSSGIALLPYIVEEVETSSLAMEYERRWVYHCIQTYQPLQNHEISNSSLVKAIRATSVNFLALSKDEDVFFRLMQWNRQ